MKKFGSIICSALLLLGLTVGSSAVANGAQPSMTVTFIDCDQGDSILVESNGHRMLVDGGKAVHAQAVEDCLRSKSIFYLGLCGGQPSGRGPYRRVTPNLQSLSGELFLLFAVQDQHKVL